MRSTTPEDLPVLKTIFTPIYPQRPGLITTAYARLQNGSTASGVISDLSLAAIPITLGAQVGSPLAGTLAALVALSHFKCVVSRNIWDNHGYKPHTLIQMIISSMQDHTPNELLYRAYEKCPLNHSLTDGQYDNAVYLIEESQNAVETGEIQFILTNKNSPKFPHTALALPDAQNPNLLRLNPRASLLSMDGKYIPTIGQSVRLMQEIVRTRLTNHYNLALGR